MKDHRAGCEVGKARVGQSRWFVQSFTVIIDRHRESMHKTTWDGEAISPRPPFGASIVVYRKATVGLEFLILHRAHEGPGFEGDWAWTPPAGARFPEEDLRECALRELKEEVGLELEVRRTNLGTREWAVFMAEAHTDSRVEVNPEHDRFEWMDRAKATEHCRPESVAMQIDGVADALSGSK